MVIGALWGWLAWPWISGTWTVPWDAKAHFQPQLQFLAGSLNRGESPFWNPNIFAGWPQVADPQSLIFVPAFVLLALVNAAPSFAAMDATVYASLLVGALSLFVYFRDRGWHQAAGAVAALSFAFGGSAAWRIQHTGQVISYAAIPLAMLLLARALERRSFGWGLLAGAAAGVLALGRDQIALLGIYLLIGQVIAAVLFGDGMGNRGLGGRVAGAVRPLSAGAIAGLAVVVVPVVLTLLLAAESNRPEIDYIGAGRGSLHPASLITAVIADLFGQGNPDVHYWGPPSAAFGVTDIYLAQNMAAFYAGAVPIAAVLMLGLGRGLLAAREIRLFAVMAALTVFYAIGWYTPVFTLFFDWLPGVKLYRRPADATFMLGFWIAVLGGYLTHRWLDGTVPPAGRFARALQWGLALLVLVVLPVAFGLHADRLKEAVKPTATAILFFGAALLVLALAGTVARGRWAALAVVLLAGFTAVDLGWNNAPNESTAYPPATFEALKPDSSDPTIRFLKARTRETATGARRDRVELAGLGFHWPNAGMVHGFDTVLGYNPLRINTFQAATAAQDTIGLPDQRLFNAMFPSYSSVMGRLLGLRYIAANVPLASIDPHYDASRIVEIAHIGETRIYENRDALPRALFVARARQADFARLLETGRWPEGFDPAREVALEVLPAGVAEVAKNAGPAAAEPGRVAIAAYHNTEVVLEVDAAEAGFVVLTDVWHRWWRAELDGRPAEMLKADAIFRAVRVPAGRHVIRFTFHPFAGAWADVVERLAHGRRG
ncbi:YfhO family protein [Hyphomicrobiaceae bacterium 22]|uniref:YfhO family protein n=1 Tax=Prosthecodimorpha staleyi TaxID=2840188 RepID=A0A947D0A5_9HYPH|nr:YfhO family protein [Prosthecodimorpha staleyi]